MRIAKFPGGTQWSLVRENVYFYSKYLQLPKYQHPVQILQTVNGLGYFPFSGNETIVPPSEAVPYIQYTRSQFSLEKANEAVIDEWVPLDTHTCVDEESLHCKSLYRDCLPSENVWQVAETNMGLVIPLHQDRTLASRLGILCVFVLEKRAPQAYRMRASSGLKVVVSWKISHKFFVELKVFWVALVTAGLPVRVKRREVSELLECKGGRKRDCPEKTPRPTESSPVTLLDGEQSDHNTTVTPTKSMTVKVLKVNGKKMVKKCQGLRAKCYRFTMEEALMSISLEKSQRHVENKLDILHRTLSNQLKSGSCERKDSVGYIRWSIITLKTWLNYPFRMLTKALQISACVVNVSLYCRQTSMQFVQCMSLLGSTRTVLDSDNFPRSGAEIWECSSREFRPRIMRKYVNKEGGKHNDKREGGKEVETRRAEPRNWLSTCRQVTPHTPQVAREYKFTAYAAIRSGKEISAWVRKEKKRIRTLFFFCMTLGGVKTLPDFSPAQISALRDRTTVPSNEISLAPVADDFFRTSPASSFPPPPWPCLGTRRHLGTVFLLVLLHPVTTLSGSAAWTSNQGDTPLS
ncbi:hypothetical protein PR048_017845 [Dryococelus australis]|uniref:Uncharacterized protein n=1 Tax=Dryococelus australis TaxID=614101 RepID=A0ABQ9HAQ8_9NEOP|nr:hypothetical protein PR048_017845 [Dryococelus australis]